MGTSFWRTVATLTSGGGGAGASFLPQPTAAVASRPQRAGIRARFMGFVSSVNGREGILCQACVRSARECAFASFLDTRLGSARGEQEHVPEGRREASNSPVSYRSTLLPAAPRAEISDRPPWETAACERARASRHQPPHARMA